MSLIIPKSYSVLMTPLVSKDTYGETLNISKDINVEDFIKETGISQIKREVDNGDFDFGAFVFGSINLTCFNFDGKFSSIDDSRSIFKFSRDRAKVTVNFYDGISNTPTSSFYGLIDDRATTLNTKKQEIKFKILSNDSIINRVKVPAGSIADGSLISTAFKSILNLPEITAVLNYVESLINPKNDYVIDVGSVFDNLIVKDALDKLLLVSDSVLFVDQETFNIHIRSREFNPNSAVKNLFGAGDRFGRENIISLDKYNQGLQRAFNTITVGTITKTDLGYSELYGDNKKTITANFITNETTLSEVAQNLLDNWKVPKEEMEIELKTSEVRGDWVF